MAAGGKSTVLQTLVLLVGVPILVFLIVIAINKIVQTIHATRGDDPRTSDPLYLVDARTGEAKLVDANPGTDTGQQALVEAARSRAMTPAARRWCGCRWRRVHPSQREWLKRAIRNAETVSGLTFSLLRRCLGGRLSRICRTTPSSARRS